MKLFWTGAHLFGWPGIGLLLDGLRGRQRHHDCQQRGALRQLCRSIIIVQSVRGTYELQPLRWAACCAGYYYTQLRHLASSAHSDLKST